MEIYVSSRWRRSHMLFCFECVRRTVPMTRFIHFEDFFFRNWKKILQKRMKSELVMCVDSAMTLSIFYECIGARARTITMKFVLNIAREGATA